MPGTATCGGRLESFFRNNDIRYQIRYHPPAYTAQEVAAAEHIPGQNVAKVVMVVSEGELTMLVLPATHRLNWDLVTAALGTDDVRLADEEEFAATFSDCEVGAMPPFGQLYGVPVYLDAALAKDVAIVFQPGNHVETMEITLADYARVVEPRLAVIAQHE